LLRIDSYTDAREKSEKAARLLAMFADDPEVSEFVRGAVAVAMTQEDQPNE
jgi:hypothetical protein